LRQGFFNGKLKPRGLKLKKKWISANFFYDWHFELPLEELVMSMGIAQLKNEAS